MLCIVSPDFEKRVASPSVSESRGIGAISKRECLMYLARCVVVGGARKALRVGGGRKESRSISVAGVSAFFVYIW